MTTVTKLAMPEGFNSSLVQAQRALRFLASNDRPIGGEEFPNALACYQIADDLEVTRRQYAVLVSAAAARAHPADPSALTASIAELEAFERDGMLLDEIANWAGFAESVMLCLHELKRLRADQMRQPQYLSPDATDIRLIREGVLPRCPCCDGTPTTFTRYFVHSGIYQSFVHCPRCEVQVFKNAHDHEDARNLAIAAWSRRPADAQCKTSTDHRDIMRSYIGGYLEEGNLTSITHDRARELAVCATNARVAVDDLMISQVLRSLMFERSDLPADANTIIYRKVDLA